MSDKDPSPTNKNLITQIEVQSKEAQCSGYQNNERQQKNGNFYRRRSNFNRNKKKNKNYFESNRNYKQNHEKNNKIDGNSTKQDIVEQSEKIDIPVSAGSRNDSKITLLDSDGKKSGKNSLRIYKYILYIYTYINNY